MKGKRNVLLSVVMIAALLLSGCGETFPDLTEDEYKQTVEFAVGLLMKYSNNDKEKLVYVDAKEVQKERDKEARKAAQEEKQESTDTTKKQSVPAKVEVSSESSSEQSASHEQPEIPENPSAFMSDDGTNASSEASTLEDADLAESTDSDAIVLSSEETQEIESDIFLSYQGYSISSTYPESSKSYVVNADKGKKLLVLRFDLYNASGSTKKINMINQNLLFQILLNGENIGYSSVTFLPNDLSSFIGEIESKAHESLVVLTQISEEDASQVSSIGMIVSMDGNEQEVILK